MNEEIIEPRTDIPSPAYIHVPSGKFAVIIATANKDEVARVEHLTGPMDLVISLEEEA
jgi:hypothetical protein